MTRDEIAKLIQDNGLFHGTMALGVVMDAGHLERFAALVAAAERGACAEICESVNSLHDYYGDRVELVCAEAIRARGDK